MSLPPTCPSHATAVTLTTGGGVLHLPPYQIHLNPPRWPPPPASVYNTDKEGELPMTKNPPPLPITEATTNLGALVSHPVLRPNRMLIVCVLRNQVYIHTVQKLDTEEPISQYIIYLPNNVFTKVKVEHSHKHCSGKTPLAS
jgi:hypothetical protein